MALLSPIIIEGNLKYAEYNDTAWLKDLRSKEPFIRLSQEESNVLTEQHMKLNGKLLKDAKKLLDEGDYV